MSYKFNKYLKVNDNVLVTPQCELVIIALDPYFKNLPSAITSCYRSPEYQLNNVIVPEFLKKSEFVKLFPEFQIALDMKLPTTEKLNLWNVKFKLEGNYYWWQMGWSYLLNQGYVINPPLKCECLFDQYRENVKKELIFYNKAGRIIDVSSHSKGTAFDISGGKEGMPSDEYNIVLKAKADGIKIKSATIEFKNNCVHVNVV